MKMRASEFKRRAEMEEDASSNVVTSKKRKTTSRQNNNTVVTVSPENSVDSSGTVVSGEFHSDRSTCSSTLRPKEPNVTPLDPEVQSKGFETVDSATHLNFNSFSFLREFSGDSEETMTPVAAEMPPKEELEEFFTMAEKYEQKRFEEKYNFDIATDTPLEGRYQWIPLH